jgi:hypothetical protein
VSGRRRAQLDGGRSELSAAEGGTFGGRRPMRPHKLLAAVLVVASLAVAAPAQAQTPTTSPSRRGQLQSDALAAIKARAKAEIDRRLVTLDQLSKLVGDARHLTSANRSTLTKQLADAKSGLTALGARIAAETDLQTLIPDARQIVTGYRVYLLVTPKVDEVVAADRMLAVTDLYDKLFAKLEGKNVDQTILADAKAKVADAKAKAQGVPGAVINLQPSGYPGNRSVLVDARQSLRAGRDDLRAARADMARLVR